MKKPDRKLDCIADLDRMKGVIQSATIRGDWEQVIRAAMVCKTIEVELRNIQYGGK
jgi:predicted RNA-binding protein with EMAP domain